MCELCGRDQVFGVVVIVDEALEVCEECFRKFENEALKLK